MTTATAPDGSATPLAASSGGARAEHCAPPCVLASDAAELVDSLPAPRPARVHRLAHGRASLDELVSGVWAAVSAGAPAACPVCDGTLRRPEPGAAAVCIRCESRLS